MEDLNELIHNVQALDTEVKDPEGKYFAASRRLATAKHRLLLALGEGAPRRPKGANRGERVKRGSTSGAIVQAMRDGHTAIRGIATVTGIRYENVQTCLTWLRAKGTVRRQGRGVYVLTDPSPDSGKVSP